MHKIRKDFDLNKLIDVSLDISDLVLTLKVWSEGGKNGLLVKISGNYGHGSAGSDDARYISWKLSEVFDHPDHFINGVVFDLFDFIYEWGDDISISHKSRNIPFLVYLHESQKEPFLYFVEEKRMRFHLRTALAEINDDMKKS